MNGPAWLTLGLACAMVIVAAWQWRQRRIAELRIAAGDAELERLRRTAVAPPSAEGELEPATARLALACASCGIAILDSDHRYRWANPAHLRLTGHGLDELRALAYQDITAADDADGELDALAGLHQGRCERAVWRRRFGPATGVRRWATVTAHAVRGSDGSLASMIWIVTPDGEGEATSGSGGGLDLALREALADHERIAGLLSHDAVQPTRMISSYAGFIAQKLRESPGDPVLKHVVTMQQASDDLRELLREAVAYLRVPQRPPAPESSRLRPAVDAVVARLAASVPSLVARCNDDAEIGIAASDLESCLHAAIALAGIRSPSGQVEIGVIREPDRDQVTVIAPDAVLRDGDTDRIFMLGARIQSADGSGSLQPGFSVARRIAVRSGGGVEVDGNGGLRVVLSFGASG